MFLGMVLAQVEAVEAGGEVGVAVARAARDWLLVCEGLLRRWGEGVGVTTTGDGDVGGLDGGGGGGDDWGFGGVGVDGGMGSDWGEFDWGSLFSDVGFS
jgi:hypothetical protein